MKKRHGFLFENKQVILSWQLSGNMIYVSADVNLKFKTTQIIMQAVYRRSK